MKKYFQCLVLASLLVLCSVSVNFALSIQTHDLINKNVGKGTWNGFSLDGYLKSNLGLSKGYDEIFNNSEVYKSMELGGDNEDAPPEHTIPYRRSRNHFHNPLLPLDQAGYTGWLSFCDIGHCPESAILWSQGPQNSDNALDFDLNPGGDWSWKQTRQNFYNALTAAAKSDRDTNFANTFRGLGQLMHLVQDMSVPEHTRNEGHYTDERSAII